MRSGSNLLSQVVCTHSLFHVESSSLCTISTVMSWKLKLQDSGKWNIIFFKVFYFWFIRVGGHCFSHFLHSPVVPVIVIVVVLIFNTEI